MLKDIEKYIFYLNKEVLVKVDRKLGEKHPNFDFIYPVNYGYIPNTLSEDNEEIDAYILGIFYPLDEFQGICKGIVCRYNDNENKLIVLPKDKEYSIEQMEALLEFQERFFEHRIIIK
ncbi:inorganic diphosphatase [Fusobacterium canifelinum]|uniref:inorganic diphosphatase n=1 Tax=Fusobacterium canifelinum TaxID=285729 RepID=A0ABX7CEC4_9FUSO|nr:inorganic diphosphatase [Fusobacterium canifelinum]QQS87876.1 inorganic diphosphatase [Fusobacterium canifelinum]